ncbi:SDR family oxidoreductase [Streptomyces sp. NPDC005811]|uniref:SDR family NAD(P)-dependent oxidoreductase n=1 Tax=Streptomyces sp. NPDC005811 TaxID=3154565 RepID=UPI0033D861F6
MRVLDGKSVIVTGAGRGIGAAYAEAIAAAGGQVVVNDVDGPAAEEVAVRIREQGGAAVGAPADITDWTQAEQLVDRCVSEFGSLDGLVNNAGIFEMSMPGELTSAQLARMWNVNVNGLAACTLPAMRHMMQAGSGSIVNVTSGAHLGIPYMVGYGATKGAVASMTYCWAMELAPHGVRVNAISPLGLTGQTTTSAAFADTHRLASMSGLGTGNKPDASANAPVAVYLLSEKSHRVTGQIVRIEGTALSLIAHPAVREPILRRESGWSADVIAEVFEGELGGHLVPLGVTPLLRAEYLDGASALWSADRDAKDPVGTEGSRQR